VEVTLPVLAGNKPVDNAILKEARSGAYRARPGVVWRSVMFVTTWV